MRFFGISSSTRRWIERLGRDHVAADRDDPPALPRRHRAGVAVGGDHHIARRRSMPLRRCDAEAAGDALDVEHRAMRGDDCAPRRAPARTGPGGSVPDRARHGADRRRRRNRRRCRVSRRCSARGTTQAPVSKPFGSLSDRSRRGGSNAGSLWAAWKRPTTVKSQSISSRGDEIADPGERVVPFLQDGVGALVGAMPRASARRSPA